MKEQENAYRHSHRENRIRELEVVKYRVSERINHTNSTIKRESETYHMQDRSSDRDMLLPSDETPDAPIVYD